TKLTTGGDGIFDFTVTGPTSYNPSISTSGGIGDNEQIVASGIYSVQETIPSNSNLVTATCNDGSSSFSVDVVSGIVINPGDAIECTFDNQIIPQGTLKITKLTTGGDGSFDFTVTGPTSYSPSITTSGGAGFDIVEPTLAISSFLDTGGGDQVFINSEPVFEIGTSGAIGNSISLSGEKITQLITLGTWQSTTGSITAYIWSGITQNATSEGSETIVAQSDTWDFSTQGNEFPPEFFFDHMIFNFSNPVSLNGDYVIGYKWSNIDGEAFITGSRDSLSGGNSVFRSDGCTVTETGTSDTWSSCHTEFLDKIRNLSMDITIEETATNVDVGTGIQTSNLVVHHTFDLSEIENGIGLNAGTFGGDANAYFLSDNDSDGYTGDWYLSNFVVNSSGILNDAHINGFNLTLGTGTVVQLGNSQNRGQWNFLHDDISNEYSISFWINGDFNAALPIPVINTFTDGVSSNGFAFGFDGGIPYITISQDAFRTNSAIPFDRVSFSGLLPLPNDGNFHLITLNVEKSNVTSTAQACIDLLCDTVDRGDAFTKSAIADRPLTIGEDHDERSTPSHFTGGRSYTEFQMDDLCIWNDAKLSSIERITLYNSGIGQSCATVVPGKGSGSSGPISIASGTYSIQETIPFNWNLVTATCNDGASSFSIDTVSGIVIDFGDNIECTFENEFSPTGTDVDGDGIFNVVDTLPNTFSNDFSDVSIGGTSSGVIVTRGDQILTLPEEANPDGVRIKADISGGILSASVDTCGGLSTIVFTPNDEVVVTCSSVTIQVISGEVEVSFFSSDGTVGTTSLSAGNSVTFNQDKFSFVTPSTNTQTIIIDVEGTQITINPGDATTSLPEVDTITVTHDPIQVGTLVEASSSFTDLGPLETHTAEWNWGDSTTTVGVITENGLTGNVTGSHTYSTPGVYTVTLTVTDDIGDSGSSVFQFVVIYDPEGGFVTGGGWIDSPAGSYIAEPSLADKATFGFVSKYQNGANTPTGNTQFSFKVADLKFKSTVYDWLVVAGSNAKLKGDGTINGQGDYGFQLFGFDSDVNTNDFNFDDKFRIKIWDKNNGDAVVYDNNLGQSDDDEPSTILGGGSIIIHS
ncbi:MAG: PKD domain-containing protein, partial [Nitrosopumilaceae archaeon]